MKKRILTLLMFIPLVSFTAEDDAAGAAASGGAAAEVVAGAAVEASRQDSGEVTQLLAKVTQLLETQETRLRALEEEVRRNDSERYRGFSGAAGAGVQDRDIGKWKRLLLALQVARELHSSGADKSIAMFLPNRGYEGGHDTRPRLFMENVQEELSKFVERDFQVDGLDGYRYRRR